MELEHLNISRDIPLKYLSTIKTGGLAQFYCAPKDTNELINCLKWATLKKLPHLVISGGSNILIPDRGFNGLVIRINNKGIKKISEEASIVTLAVQAGEIWDDFVKYTVEKNYAGVECLSGVPGLVGSSPIQNIGCYGQEACNSIKKVIALNTKTLKIKEFDNKACEFAYRNSFFKNKNDYIILEVHFALTVNGAPTLTYKDLIDAFGNTTPSLAEFRSKLLEIRSKKSMLINENDPNSISLGSFFINPLITQAKFAEICSKVDIEIPSIKVGDSVKLLAGWLIENSGFEKGYTYGNVGLSQKHALALINKGNGTTTELLEFAKLIQKKVKAKFGVELKIEPVVVN